MNPKSVSCLAAVTRSRLATVHTDAPVPDVARLLTHDRKHLVVVHARDAMRALLSEEQCEGSLLRDYVMAPDTDDRTGVANGPGQPVCCEYTAASVA